jgi:hypothetical protein
LAEGVAAACYALTAYFECALDLLQTCQHVHQSVDHVYLKAMPDYWANVNVYASASGPCCTLDRVQSVCLNAGHCIHWRMVHPCGCDYKKHNARMQNFCAVTCTPDLHDSSIGAWCEAGACHDNAVPCSVHNRRCCTFCILTLGEEGPNAFPLPAIASSTSSRSCSPSTTQSGCPRKRWFMSDSPDIFCLAAGTTTFKISRDHPSSWLHPATPGSSGAFNPVAYWLYRFDAAFAVLVLLLLPLNLRKPSRIPWSVCDTGHHCPVPAAVVYPGAHGAEEGRGPKVGHLSVRIAALLLLVCVSPAAIASLDAASPGAFSDKFGPNQAVMLSYEPCIASISTELFVKHAFTRCD